MKKQTIIISPYSKVLPNNQKNPKNYPYFKELVNKLRAKNFHIIQIGIEGEELIDADQIKFNLPIKEIVQRINDSFCWISVDNAINHIASIYTNKRGIVIFGKSDPNIFGYSQNINLLKNRCYLRKYQFSPWTDEQYNEEVFVSNTEIFKALDQLL